MHCFQLIFSPTGGTAKAAKALTSHWPDVETIDLTAITAHKHSFCKGDLVLIAMPTFGGAAPQAAIDRLQNIDADGANCVVMAVYGNRDFDDTLIQMEEAAEARGFQVIAGVSAIAQHSLLPQYGAGRPDASDLEQLSVFSEILYSKATEGILKRPAIPGNHPYKNPGKGLVPKCSSKCIECSICAIKCPVGAIEPKNARLTDTEKCIGCMRCVSICPFHARSVNKAKLLIAGLALKKACSQRKENMLYL